MLEEDFKMETIKERIGSELIIRIKGSLDTNTSPEFEEILRGLESDIQRLILDLSDLEYISSAGLRAIFVADELYENKEGILIRHPNDEVYEILEITGSTDLLVIEK